jgi:UDP-N-acetylglucosamine--N-acetylmuramyl-(pentapeptide) pyrophosphoryl-undecaprenol N-acetylglucosamine transferase
MEMEKVPAAGYAIEGLWISGIQRSLSPKNLMFPFKVLKSLAAASKIIKRFHPDVAVGTGGYASAPLLFVAHRKKIPTLIQEQNSYPGITNKLLSKNAHSICVASDGMDRFFPKENLLLTGNPVRQDLLTLDHLRAAAMAHFKLDPARKTLLVLGGSLGSRRINELINQELLNIMSSVQVIWQCGKGYYKVYADKTAPGVQVHQFIDRMDYAYSAADFVISRAGASSISELCMVGKPVLFIPSPHVAEDHQRKNAEAIVNKNAALMIEERDLDAGFKTLWSHLTTDQKLQQTLSKNIKSLALPRATKDIVDQIEKLLDGRH